jgi:hypothetical protein
MPIISAAEALEKSILWSSKEKDDYSLSYDIETACLHGRTHIGFMFGKMTPEKKKQLVEQRKMLIDAGYTVRESETKRGLQMDIYWDQ